MLYMITRENCPYCAAAKENIERLLEEDSGYKEISVIFLLENAQTREQYDYYYVPAYFWEREKLGEGEFSVTDLREILSKARCMYCAAKAVALKWKPKE